MHTDYRDEVISIQVRMCTWHHNDMQDMFGQDLLTRQFLASLPCVWYNIGQGD